MDILYKYKAVDSGGRTVEAVIEAKNEDEAVKLLRAQDLNIISLNRQEAVSKDVSELGIFAEKPKIPDIMVFCKQLSVMLDAGLPLDRALGILAEQTVNKLLKDAIMNVSIQIKQGIPFSRAMRGYPQIFPELLTNMVESGELTGKLDEVLARMSVHYDKENKINSKVKGAMIYPIVLACLVVVVVVAMLVFVMPTFTELFESGGVELPLPTRILMSISDSIIAFWWIYAIVILGAVVSINMYGKTDYGKRFFATLYIRLPIVSNSIKQIATARFTRTLATLLSSGVPIIRALEASAETTNNVLVMDYMQTVMEGIKKGSSLAGLLRKIPIFPPMMISMVSVGEETGDLDGLLEKTADFYDEELEAAMGRLVSMLEPLMIIIMAVIIGGMVISMYLPIFSLVDTIQ